MGADQGDRDSIEQRSQGSTLKLWLFLDASRIVIATVVLCGVFVGIATLLLLDPSRFERTVQRGDPIQTLFQALVTAIVTGVTLVVSINSLVLSPELGPVGEKRERMDESTAFREDVADTVDTAVAPAAPSAFLGQMLETTADRAGTLASAVTDSEEQGGVSGEDADETLTAYADHVRRGADRAAQRLREAEFGTFDVVSAALDFDYSLLLYEGKRVGSVQADAMDEDGRDALDDLLAVLHRFGPAREHVKTLYFQWELVNLSRAMLYAAVPALIVGVASTLALGDPTAFQGTTLGLSNHAWVVCLAATVALSPFVILLAYILRIATVAQSTLAIGPFVLREETRVEGARSEGDRTNDG